MHPLFAKASSLTEGIIAGAIEVHKDKGPGLVESIYEWCLTKELELRGPLGAHGECEPAEPPRAVVPVGAAPLHGDDRPGAAVVVR